MINRKLMMLTIILISLFAVSAVSAVNNVTCDVVGVDEVGDVSSIDEFDIDATDDAGGDLKANPKTFSDLYAKINSGDSEIYLNESYTFNNDSDSDYKNGIYINHAMSIYGNGSVIDGNGAARIFMVNDNIGDVLIKDIVFVNGNSTDEGGAIKGKAIVVNCTFNNNNANKGGAIFGDCLVEKCTFTNNSAVYGGAIYFDQDVSDCKFDCDFNNNSAYIAGAIYFSKAISNNVFEGNFTGNSASRTAGAIYVKSDASGNRFYADFTNNRVENLSGGAITFSNLAYNNTFEGRFEGNGAWYGGAIFFDYEANHNRFDSIFSNNHAVSCGGAIFFRNLTNGNIFNSLFIGNVAETGNGGAVTFKDTSKNCVFKGDLINNTGHIGGGLNYRVTPFNITYNGDFINNNATLGGAIHFYENTSDLVYNGIFTNNSAVNGGAIHVEGCGKIENATFIDNNAEYGGAIYAQDALNIHGCVFDANHAAMGGAVYCGNESLVSLFNCTFANNNADLNGGAVFFDNVMYPVYGFTSIENCTFRNNSARNGGAICVNLCDGSINIVNCTFMNNTAVFYGGTVHFNQGNLYSSRIENCTFINNHANYGGAVWSCLFEGSLSIINSSFKNNSAAYWGGAIDAKYDYENYPNFGLKIAECTFTNNTASCGGAINYNSDFGNYASIIANCTFTNNSAQSGGAINVQTVVVKIYDCDFIENTAKGQGGAIKYYFEYDQYLNIKTIANCTFLSNSAQSGGAIVIDGIFNNIDDCDFIANVAHERGGAILAVDAYDSIVENSFFIDNTAVDANNYAGSGAAIYCDDDSLIVVNCLFDKIIPEMEIYAQNAFGSDVVVNVACDDELAYRVNVSVANQSKLLRLKDGKGSVTFKGLASGTYTAVALYKGDRKYSTVCVNASVEVKKTLPKNLTVSAENAFGSDVVVNVSCDDELAYRVNVTVGNQSKLLRLKDGKGSVTFRGLANGNYTVVVLYKGDENHAMVSASASVEVKKPVPKNFTVSAANDFGSDVVVNVTCGDELVYRVNVTVGNESKLVRIKDGKGSVTFRGLANGNCTVTAFYKGDENYSSVCAEASVELMRPVPDIAVFADSIYYGDNLVVNVTSAGELAYRVNVTVANQSKLVRIKDGEGIVKFTGLKIGNYTVEAVYKGDENYSAVCVDASVEVR